MLSGMKVLELTFFYPAYCCEILAELGADVIKIEPPQGDPMRYRKRVYASFNKNKKILKLNLKEDEGRRKFLKIAKNVDVIVESFTPGVVKRLGIDYERVKEVNPSIIYCSISGFGQDHELKELPTHDINLVAFSGIAKISGGDPKIQISDFSSALYAVISILSAYIRKIKSGEGCYIDISMLDSAFASIPLYTSEILNNSEMDDFERNPGYKIYKVKDGEISIGILNENHFWKALCSALSLKYSELELEKRKERFEEISQEIQRKLMKFSTKDVEKIFREGRIPYGIVKSVREAKDVVRDLIGIVKYNGEEFKVVGFPAFFSNYKPKRSGKIEEVTFDI